MAQELTLEKHSVWLLATGYSDVGWFWPDLNYGNQTKKWATHTQALIGGNKA